jgi:predicted CopG family antitoxin
MNSRNERHTITLNDLSFVKLRDEGRFGESYSELILRLIKETKRTEINSGGQKNV